jgi:hypothetical protein
MDFSHWKKGMKKFAPQPQRIFSLGQRVGEINRGDS